MPVAPPVTIATRSRNRPEAKIDAWVMTGLPRVAQRFDVVARSSWRSHTPAGWYLADSGTRQHHLGSVHMLSCAPRRYAAMLLPAVCSAWTLLAGCSASRERSASHASAEAGPSASQRTPSEGAAGHVAPASRAADSGTTVVSAIDDGGARDAGEPGLNQAP